MKAVSNQWIRARNAVIAEETARLNRVIQEEGLDRKSDEEKKKRLLLGGFFPDGYDEEGMVRGKLREQEFSGDPLTFLELTSLSAWYVLHPDRVIGRETVTTSREFPLTVRGDESLIKSRFADYFKARGGEPKSQRSMEKEKMRARARGLRLRLQLEQLSGLGRTVGQETGKGNGLVLRQALQKAEAEMEYHQGDRLDFETVARTYNQGISGDEIRAWVWYKRSLGVPMTGWEKYYLSSHGGSRTISLVTTTETVIRDNTWMELRTVPPGRTLGRFTGKSHEYDSVEYLIYRDEEGMRLCRAGDVRKVSSDQTFASGEELHALVEKGALFYLEGELVPYPVYAYGNMYDRELQLREDRDHIIREYGNDAYELHRRTIREARPAQLSILNPDPMERPKILVISDFAGEFLVNHLRDELAVDFKEPTALRDAFSSYLGKLDPEDFRHTTAHEIRKYYVEARKIMDKDLTKEQKIELKANTRNEGEELFTRFLHEALTFEDQQRLDIHWNRLYNGQSSLAYHRIPIGFEASAKFRQFNLEVRPAQREGVGFINAVGSGIIAYDVGVGKTMTAIVALADAIHSGKANRPLIVVPNPTYKKWIGEIVGYKDTSGKFIPGVLSYTGIEINDWYNLGKSHAQGIDFDRKVPERSITIVTYEGMKKIGYSEKVIDEMFWELSNILGQSKVGLSERDKELDYQKFREMIGVGLKDTIADIDTLGFDAIVIDEAHRCKNIFDGVKKDDDGKKRFGLQGATSETGIKAFFLCNFIQRRYGRNVILLTATPFTNSPLEIYSMLSLVAYDAMKAMRILSIEHFFQLFVQESTEYAVNYKEEIVPKDVIKRFNNRLILQKLIYNHIIYKTGEEAGIKRPCKINLPRVNTLQDGKFVRLHPSEQTLTYLNMNPVQRENQNRITALARSATIGRVNKGLLFKSLSYSLDNALSPYLLSGSPGDYREFVENSPKILYTMECIRSVRKYHQGRDEPVSGQVIYINRGKDYFPMIKEYLEKEIGYRSGVKWGRMKVDEVEIISSGMSNTRKENVKEAFLDGAVKIIIGTATIREGIDLQKRSTVLYNLYPDWNPTDIRQLEGRIWRQGNRHGFVRVVMPLVQDSMDVFIFQKLEEKTSRINDIWYRGDRGNVLDLESLDPEEIKFALITDVNAIAGMKLKAEQAELSRRMQGIRRNLQVLGDFERDYNAYKRYRETLVKDLENLFNRYRYDERLTDGFPEEELRAVSKTEKEKYQLARDAWAGLMAFMDNSSRTDKEILALVRRMARQNYMYWNSYQADLFKEFMAKVLKAEKTVLKKKGYSLDSNIAEVIESYQKDLGRAEADAERLSSPEYLEELTREAHRKKSALQVDGKTAGERAKEFARLNYLMSFPALAVDNNDCVTPPPSQEYQPERKAGHPDRDAVRARSILKARGLKIRLRLLEL